MGDERRRVLPEDQIATAMANIVVMLEQAIDESSDLGSMMDVDTAGAILNLSPSMVRLLCQKGPDGDGLDAQKLGGEWRITRASIEARLGRGR
jgi:hypothetical protein